MKERMKEQMNKLREKRFGRSFWNIRSNVCGFVDDNFDVDNLDFVGGLLVSNTVWDIMSYERYVGTPVFVANFSKETALDESDQAIIDSFWTLIEVADLLVATE